MMNFINFVFSQRYVDLLKSLSSPLVNEYIDRVFSEGCYYVIDKPTGITPHSSTLLNYVNSTILNKTLTGNILQYEISDHLPTLCSVFLKPDRINNHQIHRCTANFSCDNFIDGICCIVDRLHWSASISLNSKQKLILHNFMVLIPKM